MRAQQFRSIGSSFTTCFDWLMGGVDFTIFQDTHNPQVGVILLLLYWCVLPETMLAPTGRAPRNPKWAYSSYCCINALLLDFMIQQHRTGYQ